MASNRIKGITIELSANTVKLTDALKDVDSNLKKTQTQLNDVNRLLKLDPKNTELLAQKQKLLTSAISDTKTRQKELNDALEQMKAKGDTSKAAIEQQNALKREIEATNISLKKYQDQMNSMKTTLSDVANKTQELADKTKVLSTAAVAGLTGLASLAVKAGQTADDLNTLSKQTGFTTEELQKMKYAADRIDVSMETITGAAQKMTKQLSSSEQKFTDLNVATKNQDGTFRNVTDIFYDTITALSQIENETQRDAAAMEIFGKSANELAGIVDDGGAALRQLGEEAENAGLILSQDTLDAANKFNDAIDELKAKAQAAFMSTGATLAENLVPAMEKLLEVGGKLLSFIANLDSGTLEMITTTLLFTAALSPTLKAVSEGIKLIDSVRKGLTLLSGASIPATVASLGTMLPVLAAIAAAATAAIVLIDALNQKKKNDAWSNYTGSQTAGMTQISATQASNWMNRGEVQTILNPAGEKTYYVRNSDYSWGKANAASNGWTDDSIWGSNVTNMTVNVDHINDLQDLIDMRKQAQLVERMK